MRPPLWLNIALLTLCACPTFTDTEGKTPLPSSPLAFDGVDIERIVDGERRGNGTAAKATGHGGALRVEQIAWHEETPSGSKISFKAAQGRLGLDSGEHRFDDVEISQGQNVIKTPEAHYDAETRTLLTGNPVRLDGPHLWAEASHARGLLEGDRELIFEGPVFGSFRPPPRNSPATPLPRSE